MGGGAVFSLVSSPMAKAMAPSRKPYSLVAAKKAAKVIMINSLRILSNRLK